VGDTLIDYGLVIGVNNNIQFDSRRQVLGMWESGTATSWTQYTGGGCGNAYYHEIDSGRISAICAVRPPTGDTVCLAPDACTPAHSVGGLGDVIVQTGTGLIEYALYSPDTNAHKPLPGWGLVTYGDRGEIVFNSGNKYLKIREIVDVDRNTLVSAGSVQIEHETENPYYIVPRNIRIISYYISGNFGACFRTHGVRKLSSTTAEIKVFSLFGTGPVTGSPRGINPYIGIPNPFRIAICTL